MQEAHRVMDELKVPSNDVYDDTTKAILSSIPAEARNGDDTIGFDGVMWVLTNRVMQKVRAASQ